MRPATFALTVFLSSAAPTAVLAQQRDRMAEVEDLMQLATPDKDDWATEQVSSESDKQLKLLAHAVEHGTWEVESIATLFQEGARSTSLLPAKLNETSTSAGVVAKTAMPDGLSAELTGSLPETVTELFPSNASIQSRRIKFKTVGVELLDDNRWTTRVRFEIFSERSSSYREQTGELRIAWTRGDGAESEQEPRPPRIREVQLLGYQEVVSTGQWFSDCTGTVIGDDPDARLQLGNGSEYWFGRIDAVGETHFMGHQGIAVGDVNNDGLDDIYIGMGTGLPNKLLVQQPDGTVEDRALEAGVAWLDDTKGVLLIDADNDGDEDLFLTMNNVVVWCRNEGGGRFIPFRAFQPDNPSGFYSMAAADYDLDGDLDIYATRYVHVKYGVSIPVPFHDANNGPPNHLLRNDGDAGFTDVTAEVGLNVNNSRFSLAATWIDYDLDGDPDLYVANDFGRNNLYRNDGGKFVDVAAETGTEDQAAGMGASWSDYDLDGDLDLYVSNMFSSAGRRIAYQPRFKKEAGEDVRREIQHHSFGNSLFHNDGDGTFTNVAVEAGVFMGRWSWGSQFADINNDGYDDIIVPNGFLTNDYQDDL